MKLKQIGILHCDEVAQLRIANARRIIEYNNVKLIIRSKTLEVFEKKGVVCVACYRVGRYYSIELADPTHRYYNLVLRCADGRKMTKDHILPVSKGGKTFMDNLQPMCSQCNNKKGDKIELKCESQSSN